MRGNEEIRWKYFLDKKSNKNSQAIINGGKFSRQLEDEYFEVKILEDGRIHLKVEDERFFFYKSKLDVIYEGMTELIYKLTRSEEYAFYDETTFNNTKIVERVYSTIENENW